MKQRLIELRKLLEGRNIIYDNNIKHLYKKEMSFVDLKTTKKQRNEFLVFFKQNRKEAELWRLMFIDLIILTIK